MHHLKTCYWRKKRKKNDSNCNRLYNFFFFIFWIEAVEPITVFRYVTIIMDFICSFADFILWDAINICPIYCWNSERLCYVLFICRFAHNKTRCVSMENIFFMEWNLSGSFRLQKFKIKTYLRLWLNHPFHTLLHLQIINLTHRIGIAAVSVYWSFLILLLLCLIIISLCCTIVLALCTESIQFSGVSLSLFVALN